MPWNVYRSTVSKITCLIQLLVKIFVESISFIRIPKFWVYGHVNTQFMLSPHSGDVWTPWNVNLKRKMSLFDCKVLQPSVNYFVRIKFLICTGITYYTNSIFIPKDPNGMELLFLH